MNKQRKTSNILNVFQYDEATGIIGLNGVPVSGYGLYLHTNINDGSVGIDSSSSINALYLLKSGTKQFEISYDTSGVDKIFRLLPYQSGSFFQIGNPSNAGANYVFISEPTYGNVLIGPGIGNGTGNLTGATAATHKIQFNGAVFANSSIQATSFKITGGAGTGFLKADGSVDTVSYLSGNQTITVSGDASGSGTTSINLTLANTAVTPGTYGSSTLVPIVTVDSKGRITNVSTASISGALTFTGEVTGTGTTGSSTTLTLANSGVTAGTYTKVTVDSKGRVTVGANATTSDISEGTNLYYTDARVLSYLGANNYATQSYVTTQINNLVAGAPGLLDTLDELAAALGDDANFATTTATSLGNRLRVDTAAQGLTSTQQGYGRTNLGLGTAALFATGDFATAAQGTKADTAHGWGNHASAGYLTTSSAASTYVSLTGSYANPSWITSLAYSKLTGVPAFLTSYTETDTLATVTSRGSSTSTTLNLDGRVNIGNGLTRPSALNSDSVAHARIGGADVHLYIASLGAGGGYKVAIQSARTSDFASFGLDLQANGGTLFYGGNEVATRTWVTSQGYITGYSETDTLATVTARGASTTAGINVNGRVTAAGGGTYAVTGSSTQRYIIQALNTSNSVNSSYGWWWFHNTNGDMGFHADAVGDILTLTRAGGATINGNTILTAGNYSSYALPLSGGTMTGQILGPSIGSDVYGGAIQIRERGYVLAAQSDWSYSPAITFHWGNRWAKRFGGRYDGLFAIDDEPIALRSWVSSQGFLTSLPSHNHDDRYYTESESDSRFLRGTTDPGSVNNFTISIGNNGSYSYVQSHSGQPLELNPVGNAVRIAGQTVIHSGNISSQSVSYAGSAGNADTVDSLHASSFVRRDTTLQYLKPYYEYGSHLTTESPSSLADAMGGGGLRVDFMNPGGGGSWSHVITWSGYNRYSMSQIGTNYNTTDARLYYRQTSNHDNSWAGWKQFAFYNDSPTFQEVYANGWFRTTGSQGLYNPTNDAHFYPNTASYGSWRIDGSKNGWHGLHFAAGTTLMMNSNESGHHREGYGWQFRWTDGTFYVHGNSYGGGTGQAVIHAGNIGSQSVSYASSAGTASNSNTVGGIGISTLRGGISSNNFDFYVNGDANTYYPVVLSLGGQYGMHRYSISRGYSDPAPWDPIGTGSHRGGLTLTFDCSSDIAWGGNDKSWRIIQFSEQYTNMVAGMALPVTDGIIVWLRGGGAYYRFHGPSGINHGATVYYSGYTGANGASYGIRTNTSNVSSEIFSKFPIRGYGDGDMYVNNQVVLNAGNRSSYIDTVYYNGSTRLYTGSDGTRNTGWAYHQDNSTGLHWPNNGWHFYPKDASDMYVRSGSSGASALVMNTAGTNRGYVYANSGNEIGFLNADRNWILRMTYSGDMIMDYNYGNSIVGVYSSYRFQGVFSMGNAYKLAIDGTSPGNLYGMSWSHPNAGGQASRLNDHGLMVMINGVTQSAFSSNIWAAGDITAYSDIRVKTNIKSINDAVKKVQSIRGVTFTRTDMTDTTTRHAGVIAQEILEVLPEVVTKDGNGHLSVAYGNLNALLIEAIKEQQKQIEELQNKLDNVLSSR